MIRAKYPDLTTLWHKTSRGMLVAGPIGSSDGILDWKGSSETYSYSNILRATSMAYDFDVGRDLSLNRSRFTTLQRAYLDPDDLDGFMARVKKIGAKGGTASRGVLTTMTVRQKEGKSGKYLNGPCIMGYGWRGGQRGPNPTLTLHSRTTYISYMGGMDLALCWVLARDIGEMIGMEPEDISFEWFSDSLCYHNYKALPYAMVHARDLLEAREEYPIADHPTMKLARGEWDKMHENLDTPLEQEKWGARRRVWRRFRELEDGGGPPDCPVESLTLDALYARRKPEAEPPWTKEEKQALIHAIKNKTEREGNCYVYTGQKRRPYRSHRGKLYPMARLILSMQGKMDHDDRLTWGLHTCDNGRCIRPSHLYAGTPSDNINDSVERGGLNVGENNGRSILTEATALAVRDASGTLAEVAEEYGVSKSCVRNIKSGKRWAQALSVYEATNDEEEDD